MPYYNYICRTCEKKVKRRLKRQKREEMTKQEYEEECLFETSHAFDPTPKELAEATVCPRCQGTDCDKTMYGVTFTCYVRGNGYLDKEGCHRDMNRHKLETDDPYGNMRVPGEVDEMKAKLKRAGQHNPNTKTFAPDAKGMEQAVSQAANSPTPPPAPPTVS